MIEQPQMQPQQPPESESIQSIEFRLNKITDRMNHERIEKDLAEQASGETETASMPWGRLSERTKALRPGCLLLIGGPTKTGKSFFMANIAWKLFCEGYRWAYLPLEDSRKDFVWRMLGVMTNSYAMIDTDKDRVEERREAYRANKETILEIARFVSENPRHGHKNKAGETIIPPLPHTKVIEWAKEAASQSRVIFIDPIAQIEFDGVKPWKVEAEFVRHLLAIATDSRATIVVAGHTVKRGGANAAISPTVEDFQGAAEWTRLAHTVILIDGHEERSSQVYRIGGHTADETHNRTVIIGAARNGSGTRSKLAFNQSSVGPSFEELGVIAPKKKKGEF